MRRLWILPALSAILAILLASLSAPLVRYALAFVFLWVLPGLAWATLLPRQHLSTAEWLTFALGFSFLVTPLATLFLAYLPGPLTQSHLLLTILGLTTLPILLIKRAELAPVPPTLTFWRRPESWLLLALLIAAALRITNLGYAEFQGDEGTVMVRAAQALEGDETILFQHKKGPAELLVVMAPWRLTGITNEWMARLPFTFASLIAIAAAFCLTLRLTNLRTAALVAGILAIEGYFTAFGRIVQYQSLVFLLSTLGLLALVLYRTTSRTPFLFFGAACFAGGFLGHYDAALALPAGLLLLVDHWWPKRHQGWPALRPLLFAALLGLALILPFYLPFLTSPFMEYTQSYLSERLGESQFFHNNLWRAFRLSAVYNSIYLLLILPLLWAAQAIRTWGLWGRRDSEHASNATARYASLGALLCMLLLTALLWPTRWIIGEGLTVAWIPAIILFTGALLAPHQSVESRFLWLWFSIPALFYLFIVGSPNTHIHTFFTAGIILGGITLTEASQKLSASKTLTYAAATMGLIAYGLCGYYTIMMFVDHTPEYRRTFPEFKNPLYWTPYEEIPKDGLFGFPYRAGWKVVGYLMDQGKISSYYKSNEEPQVSDYYTRHATWWHCPAPDIYVAARNVQDELSIDWEQIQRDYQPVAIVEVNGQPNIVVHQREDTDAGPITYEGKAYDWQFDLSTTPERIAWSTPKVESALPQNYVPLNYAIGEFAHLRGYRLETDHATPDGYIDLTLFWEGVAPTAINYHIFIHLYDGETMRGQLDRQPVCDSVPTSTWQAGQIIRDRHRIFIEANASTGSVPLILGMYDLATMQRVPIATIDGEPIGDSVHITDVVIQTP